MRDYFGTNRSHKVTIYGPNLIAKISRFYSKWHDEYAYYVIACTDILRDNLTGIANRYARLSFFSDISISKHLYFDLHIVSRGAGWNVKYNSGYVECFFLLFRVFFVAHVNPH
jgi:hypothetical protein